MYAAAAAILISEIMYNPASSERRPVQTEWVEIYNAGNKPASLAGCYLQDEDGRTDAIPKGVTIKPGEALVLIPGVQTVKDFQTAWGKGFAVIPLKHWSKGGIRGLSNSPSPTNEILTFRDKAGKLIDEVNYDDVKPWPSDRPDGPSITLLPDKLTAQANDQGKNWRRSKPGQYTARHAHATNEYSSKDVGSPGTVVKKKNKRQDAK